MGALTKSLQNISVRAKLLTGFQASEQTAMASTNLSQLGNDLQQVAARFRVA